MFLKYNIWVFADYYVFHTKFSHTCAKTLFPADYLNLMLKTLLLAQQSLLLI